MLENTMNNDFLGDTVMEERKYVPLILVGGIGVCYGLYSACRKLYREARYIKEFCEEHLPTKD